MKIIVQMDPIEKLNLSGDSTYALLIEAQKRNYSIDFYTPDMLTLDDGILYVDAFKIKMQENPSEIIKIAQINKVRLEKYDVILMRQDPPFNMSYITATHLLETIRNKVLIINDPFYVRNCPEKLFVNNYKQFMPPTLITRNINEIMHFKEKYDQFVIKPLYGNGGSGVFYSDKNDKNFQSIVDYFMQVSEEQFILQKFIPKVEFGDKRIILINGKIAGAINRIPKSGEIRSNMHVGGQAVITEISEYEKKICSAISKDLIDFGLFFVGIDVIDNLITEINVTSPTGIREIYNLTGNDLTTIFWDEIESKIN
ncbi:MAG: glutathione synthase [Hyphomicrobiales bacterium]|jgi:glutathione synthase|nr:glutathione synthase [Hyphomicrobiales bacterium]|tara:strand:+ start:2559 stop:3494 length:936 start_codon:yes stop_codon:yes gene_type:complete